ncbi:MAG: hypothetical protein QOE76_3047 [Frankiales bacterium]|nr:hypothetical protein [Frankiales bacterium]
MTESASMDVVRTTDQLAAQGRLLVDAARRAGSRAPVPSCPEWTVADLLRHVGEVHRWAGAIVAEAAPENLDSTALLGELPAVAGLADWVADGHRLLVATLRAAPSDLECWQFLRAPSPLEFWARRQLHETSVHRMDAELAAGTAISPVPRDVAEDGIDELLTGFVPRPSSRLRSQRPCSLLVAPTDSALRWWVGISEDPPVTVREQRPADAVLSAPAGELYPALWNRAELPGEAEVVALWRDSVTVRWS